MIRKLTLLIILCLALIPSVAQNNSPPLIINLDRALYAVENGELRQLVDSGYADSPRYSPDGRYVAYNQTSQAGLDAIERVGGFSGPMADDVRLLDVSTGESRIIAGQPSPAYFWDDTQPDNVFARSSVSWSPDGTQIAWTDYAFADGELTLGVYDLASDTYASVLIDLPPQMGVPSPIGVLWLNSGIVIRSRTFDNETSEEIRALRLYTSDGGLITGTPMMTIDTPQGRIGAGLFLVHDGLDFYAQYDAADDLWILTNILTGERFSTPAYPELVSATNPDTSLRAIVLPPIPHTTEFTNRVNEHFQMVITDAARDQLTDIFNIRAPATIMSTLTIAPDGSDIAYRVYNTETRVHEDVINFAMSPVAVVDEDSFLSAITWGATQWVLPDNATLTPLEDLTVFDCPQALLPRLTIGGTATVLPGDPNRIRNSPSTGGEVVGNIAAGEVFTVLNGPVCDGEIVWWRVDYNGVIGWTAESVGDYFVEPLE